MAPRSMFLLAAVAVAVVLPVQACWACSCLAGTPEEYWEWSTAVFDGNPTDRSEPDANGMITWTFEVVDAWKGVEGTTVEVTSHESSATCGVSFELGTTYRVFASEGEGALTTGSCSGSAPVDSFEGPPAQASGGGSSGNEDPDAPDSPDDPTGRPTGPDEPVSDGPDSATDEPTVVATPLAGPDGGEVAVDTSDDGNIVLPVALVGGGIGLLGLVGFLVRRSASG